MIPSVTPNATATPASRQARSRTRSRSERASPRPPNAATSTALDQSRSPVIWAGVTWSNIRAARPAPTWTETMPVSTSAEGGTTLMAPAGRRNSCDRVAVVELHPLFPQKTRDLEVVTAGAPTLQGHDIHLGLTPARN